MKEMIKRADGSYSQRGLWDNIRANAGSNKKPTKEMLQQEKKIEKEDKMKEKKSTPAWTREEGKNPEGGLNAKGRESYNKETGGHLKAPVKKGDNPRRVSFAARFAGMAGGMVKPNGEPTRKALALKAWGFNSVEEARSFANKHKKS